MNKEAENYLARARDMVAATDMESIITLVPRPDLLPYSVATMITAADVMNGKGGMDNSAWDELWTASIEAGVDHGDFLQDAVALFIVNVGGHTEYANKEARRTGDEYNPYADHYELIRFVYKRPELVPYAAVGLRDADFIYHCIAEDIDPEMAVKLR